MNQRNDDNSRVKVNKQELQILLNLEKNKSISLSYPFFKLDFFEARVKGSGYNLKLVSKENDFENLKNFIGDKVEEFPKYEDIYEILFLSDIIEYDNLHTVLENRYFGKSEHKKVFYALDTNLFYHGFPFHNKYGTDVNFLVSNVVYEEIESSINSKYSKNTITEMKELVKYNPNLLNILLNRKTKKSRKATYAAMQSYSSISDQRTDYDSEYYATKDSEENDKLIVWSLRDFDHNNPDNNIVFLTADSNASDICRGKGPDCHFLKYPGYQDFKWCTPQQLIDLIYWSSIIHGIIKCNSVIICGEYPGKGKNDTELQLMFQNSDLRDKFKTELDICRKLLDLNIIS
ncbi:PIN domain-containing protein [Methanosalsum natronophilum]|uniref:PIN domain-containing protein n=1 Tax=Methanosalsum natronophilum TaxID=768733 RepID=UPI002168E403|nr:PIN domain-containing protein [Methanosalsum natronophilum]MCS3924851.1 hypothetical protein [Methanosalsum natronophilum]